MNYSLRRRHFFIWIILAIVLPVLFILSWTAIPALTPKVIKKPSTQSAEEVLSDNQPWVQVIHYLPI